MKTVNIICGELMTVPEEDWPAIDRLEVWPSLYGRQEIE